MNFSTAHMDLPGASPAPELGLSCLSFDHHSANFALLERIERHTDALTDALGSVRANSPGGAVVLATCNRFEAYFDQAPGAPERALHQVAELSGISVAELSSAARMRHGIDVAHHLFSVTSGLESMVVGEGEISGQVRRALTHARRAGATTPSLEQLFQRAANVSKDVKRRTRVQTRGRSLVRLALFLAESRVGDWAGTRILLVGTGAYAAATLAALRDRGVTRIAVHSPSGRAEAFAATRGVRAISPEDLEAELTAADIVIACSTAQDPLIDAALIERTVTPTARPYCTALIGRAPGGSATPFSVVTPPRPRLFIDLGMPRNIAPDAAQISGIELLDLDIVARHAGVEELSAEAEARKIASDAAQEFAAAQAERDTVPTVRALHDHVHAVLEAEIARLRSNPAAAELLEPALRHFAGRLLHQPTLRIRELGRAGNADAADAAVRALFPVAGPDQHAA